MISIAADPSSAVVEFLVNAATKAIEAHGAFFLGVSGGSMASFLGSLGAFTDFSKWHVFLVDERAVPLEHDDSNYRAIQAAWSDSLSATWYPINENLLEDLDALAADYESKIKAAFETFRVDRFDCLLLGLGPDGHTASLFPGHSDFLNNLESDKLVIPVSDSPKPPPRRISLSPKAIQNAATSAFVVTKSASKAPVIASIVDGKDPTYPPTSVAPNANWFLDEISASHLKPR